MTAPRLRTVRSMRDPAAGGDRDLPLFRRLAAHRFTTAQLVAIDVVTVVLVAVICGFVMPRRTPRVSGTAWDAAGWAAYAVAAVVTLFRRRFPRADAGARLARRGGGPVPAGRRRDCLLCRHGPVLRRGRLLPPGRADHRRPGGRARSWPPSSSVAARGRHGRHRPAWRWCCWAGWPGRTPGPAGCTPPSRPSGPRRRRRPPRRSEPSRSAGRWPTNGREIARELHDIVAHAMSVIAVRSGVARMVIDTDPSRPARLWPSSRPPPAGHCTRCGCWSACCATPRTTTPN